MFFPLPEHFKAPGKFNKFSIEHYFRDEVHSRAAGRFHIVIELTSNRTLTAIFESETERNEVYRHFDRYMTDKDKVPQYDTFADEV